ncbi:MAG: DUF1800 domain-containing protein [Acidimicrobiales bacterium]
MADAADIAHLLRRTEFVARPARVAELSALSISDAVNNILDFTPNGNPTVPPELAVQASDSYTQGLACFHWWYDMMATRPRPLQEKMTLFWHGHFVSEADVVGRNDQMMEQNQLFRSMAVGDFRALTHAMSLQPAMLIYLSNAVNVKGTPNQNFARELFELFTLGVGNYTEDDVAESARAWTGHNYNSTTRTYEFRSTKHDYGDKTIFGTRRNWDGPEVIDEVLLNNVDKRLIAAKYISKKLWEFFAHLDPAQNIVDELAAVFVSNNLSVLELLRALFNRTEFYSPQAKQGLVRTPTEWVVALLVQTGLSAATVKVFDYSGMLGQRIFDPPNVAGWKANTYWLTTSALSGRANLAKRVASLVRANGAFDNLITMSVADSVDAIATYLGIALAPVTRQALIDAHQAERIASNGSNAKAITNLLVMAMLTAEMNVPS